MQTDRSQGSHAAEDGLCGLAVYSSDLVPLGRVADVQATAPTATETIAGRCVTIEPNPTVRHVLGGEDLVVSESMIFHAAPAADRVILNLPARRLIGTARQTREHVQDVAD